MNIYKAVEVMEKAALRTGRMLVEFQPKNRRLESCKDFVTEADLRSENAIITSLMAEYPDVPIFSEEKGGRALEEGLLWIVDPVDGTINFFMQDDHWGISIALARNGSSMAGVICLPGRKQIFSAVLGIHSKYLNFGNKKCEWINIDVNQEKNCANSQFWVGWGKEEHGGEDHKRVYELISRLDRQSLYPQIRNCATADMMMVATGKIAGFVFLKPDPFDIAAAALIVELAGGKVTDTDGNPWNAFSRSLVASNGFVHDELLEIIKGL